MKMKRKPTLKEDLAMAQKANTLVNTELAVLKTQYDIVRANLSLSQLERLRLGAIIDGEIEWLGTIPKAEAIADRVKLLRKENTPR